MTAQTKSSEKIKGIFKVLQANNPEPKGELNYTNNFTLLVAVILSAQATDTGVNKATAELFKYYNTPKKMLELGLDGLKSYIKSVGLYNSKAKNIIAMCEVLENNYNGRVPDSLGELTSLPGVGRKSANVILNIAYGKNTLAVDTHVYRVAKRLGIAYGNTVEKVEKELMEAIPENWLAKAHHQLILHGRYICKSKSPKCEQCILQSYCDYYNYGGR